MSTALHLCKEDDAPVLTDLMTRYAQEHDLAVSAEDRSQYIAPLLDNYPYGMAYLFGPRRAPLGYTILTISYSITSGGLEATVQELYLRDAVRGRGLPIEILHSIAASLRASGVKALHIAAAEASTEQHAEYAKAGFESVTGQASMIRQL